MLASTLMRAVISSGGVLGQLHRVMQDAVDAIPDEE